MSDKNVYDGKDWIRVNEVGTIVEPVGFVFRVIHGLGLIVLLATKNVNFWQIVVH